MIMVLLLILCKYGRKRDDYDGRKSVEIILPLKYLRTFWRILDVPSINCEINLILTWSANCVIGNLPKSY